jgi:transcriptional antiterminator NusG
MNTEEKKCWFILHILLRYEKKIKEELIKIPGCYEVLVPKEDFTEITPEGKVTKEERLLPGYLLVHMDNSNILFNYVKKIEGVIRILSNSGIPTPIMEEEINRLTLRKEDNKGVLNPYIKSFQIGNKIRIIDGPFSDFTGIIEEIDNNKGKATVSVYILGRTTPVLLSFFQIENES